MARFWNRSSFLVLCFKWPSSTDFLGLLTGAAGEVRSFCFGVSEDNILRQEMRASNVESHEQMDLER